MRPKGQPRSGSGGSSSSPGPTTLAGDVVGDTAATAVQRLRGRDISDTAPTDGQSYAWSASGNEWAPVTPSPAGASTLEQVLDAGDTVRANQSIGSVGNLALNAESASTIRLGGRNAEVEAVGAGAVGFSNIASGANGTLNLSNLASANIGGSAVWDLSLVDSSRLIYRVTGSQLIRFELVLSTQLYSNSHYIIQFWKNTGRFGEPAYIIRESAASLAHSPTIIRHELFQRDDSFRIQTTRVGGSSLLQIPSGELRMERVLGSFL